MAKQEEDPKEMIARMEREMNAPANIQGTAQVSDSGESNASCRSMQTAFDYSFLGSEDRMGSRYRAWRHRA